MSVAIDANAPCGMATHEVVTVYGWPMASFPDVVSDNEKGMDIDRLLFTTCKLIDVWTVFAIR